MTRSFTPRIVAAMARLAGDIVYLTEDGHWTRQRAEAEVIEDEAIAQLRLIEASAQAGAVTGAHLAEAQPGGA